MLSRNQGPIMFWHQLETAHGDHGLNVNAADSKSVAS